MTAAVGLAHRLLRRAAGRPTSAARWPCAAGSTAGASTASTWPSSTCATAPAWSRCVVDGAADVRSEYVVRVVGTVRRRPEGTENPNLASGEIEVGDCTVEVLAEAEPPPFPLNERVDVDENQRLRYRYLDLRRERLQRNLRLRAGVNSAIRAPWRRRASSRSRRRCSSPRPRRGRGTSSCPPGSSRAAFYALPQSPSCSSSCRWWAGIDRYYQIARCLRDEDLRADRQFEFTQLDLEACFVSQDEILGFVTEAVAAAAEVVTGERPPTMPDHDLGGGQERFGSDKPDVRFGMELVELTAAVRRDRFNAFQAAVREGPVRPGGAGRSRSQLDELTEQAKRFGAKGLVWMRVEEGGDALLAGGQVPQRGRGRRASLRRSARRAGRPAC